MNRNSKNAAVNQYAQTKTQTEVGTASPHRLVQMLFDGVLEKIAKAKGHMERGEIVQKGENISWAISIIDGLSVSLDTEAGGEVAENLAALYDYAQRKLLAANIENNISYLEEISILLKTVKSSWDMIPETDRWIGKDKVTDRDSITHTTA